MLISVNSNVPVYPQKNTYTKVYDILEQQL